MKNPQQFTVNIEINNQQLTDIIKGLELLKSLKHMSHEPEEFDTESVFYTKPELLVEMLQELHDTPNELTNGLCL